MQLYALYWKTDFYWLKQLSHSQKKGNIGTHCLCTDQLYAKLLHTHLVKSDFHMEEAFKKVFMFFLQYNLHRFRQADAVQTFPGRSGKALQIWLVINFLVPPWAPRMLVIFVGALGVNEGNKEKNTIAAMNLNLLSREQTPELQRYWVRFSFHINFCLAILVAN